MKNSGSTYVTMREFVGKAIDFERLSAGFYRDLAAETDDAEAKRLLTLLEREEEQHIESLEGFGFDEQAENRIQFTANLELSMPETPEDRSIDSLFDVADAREEKSVRLYEYAADFATGKFKNLLDSLAEFERGHVRYLRMIRRQFADG